MLKTNKRNTVGQIALKFRLRRMETLTKGQLKLSLNTIEIWSKKTMPTYFQLGFFRSKPANLVKLPEILNGKKTHKPTIIASNFVHEQQTSSMFFFSTGKEIDHLTFFLRFLKSTA